jgi:tetratricopeptide (TPR) repeat protein
MRQDEKAPVIDRDFNDAIRYYGEGRLPQAEEICRKILADDPDHPKALSMLGVLAYASGEADRAVELLSRTIAVKPDYAEAHSNLGNLFRDLGRLAEAEESYRRALDLKPEFADFHNNLGVILTALGRLDDSVASCRQAITLNPDLAEAHNSLGSALHALGRLDEAIPSYHKAIAIKPDYAEAHSNLGITLRELGRLDEALPSFRKALAFKPNFAEAHYNFANALKDLGKLDEAVASFHKALAINPNYAEAHNNLGLAFKDLGKLDEAVASYHKALAIKPDYAGAHSNLAIVLHSDGRRSEALDHFKRSLELERGGNPIDPQHKSFRFINKAKMNHDIEQFRYLASLGHETERFQSLIKVYEAVDSEMDWPSDDGMTIPLSDDHRQRLGDTYNRPIHLLEAPEVTGSTLSNTLNVEEITAGYFAHSSGMTYFDDLLSPNALASLRRFLLDSTIWFDFSYKGGYLGAMLQDGLSCPLLFQIAEDLRQTFPNIFKDHQLTQSWAYKYDSRLSGIGVHADFAAINVNFWITPDTANLNPASGGLVVYDAEAPLDWNFKTYNTDENRIRTYLADQDSGKTVVPYGENRIVLFNSNLFHETDTIDFKQGYENRRINITMLFGNREN